MLRWIVPALVLTAFAGAACGEVGSCSITCGGPGTGQPTFFKVEPYVDQAECLEIARKRNDRSCKISYCPPTGDSNDCIRVWPEES